MNNEEFQKLILEKFDKLESGQSRLESEIKQLRKDNKSQHLEMMKEAKAIREQTAILTESDTETKQRLSKVEGGRKAK